MNDQLLDIHYDIPTEEHIVNRHTLSVVVDNEFGVLARVISLFSGRGYNIESLTVAEIEHDKKRSRITVVTSGNEMTIEQIKRLLEKMVPVYKVHDLTSEGAHIERELALVKIGGNEKDRMEALKIADIFTARIVDSTPGSFIFEVTGGSDKIDQFIDLMKPLGLVEVCRTGVAAMSRGKEGI